MVRDTRASDFSTEPRVIQIRIGRAEGPMRVVGEGSFQEDSRTRGLPVVP